MTLREFTVYYEQQIQRLKDQAKIQERFAGRICSIIANANRDSKKRRKPYSEEDFMSGRKKGLSPDQFATMLKAMTLACGGEIHG